MNAGRATDVSTLTVYDAIVPAGEPYRDARMMGWVAVAAYIAEYGVIQYTNDHILVSIHCPHGQTTTGPTIP